MYYYNFLNSTITYYLENYQNFSVVLEFSFLAEHSKQKKYKCGNIPKHQPMQN